MKSSEIFGDGQWRKMNLVQKDGLSTNSKMLGKNCLEISEIDCLLWSVFDNPLLDLISAKMDIVKNVKSNKSCHHHHSYR